jgi:glycosyltransferase involved in cell wall biosynthesis
MTSLSAHVSTAHPRNDTRIFLKELASISQVIPKVHFLVADGLGNCYKNNIRIIDFGSPKSRFTRMVIKPLHILIYIIRKKFKIVHIHDPELLLMSYFLTFMKVRVIYDAHEDYREDILSREWIPNSYKKIISRCVGFLEDFFIKRFYAVIAATPKIYQRHSQNANRIIVINNFPILNEFNKGAYQEPIPNSIKEVIRVCYIGAIAEERGIEYLVDALAQSETEIFLELGGTFSDPLFKDKLTLNPGWKFVNYHGQVSRNEMSKIFSKCIAGVVTYLPEKSHLEAQPNKLFEYLSAGLPIICSDFLHWKCLLDGHNCAIFVCPDKPSNIVQAINDLYHSNEYISMGQNGKLLVEEQYNWETDSKILINFYLEALEGLN